MTIAPLNELRALRLLKKAMVKTILKWFILLLLLAYVTCITIWAGDEASRHTCRGTVINIERGCPVDSLTTGGVEREIARWGKTLKGTPMFEVDTRAMERHLSALSNFEKVECSIHNDGKVHVDVVPMIPEIRVFDSTGSYYINKDGKKIKSKALFFADVPVVSGNFSKDFPASSLLDLVRFINSDKALSQLVGMIEAKDADNIFLVPRIHGHVVNFGDTSRREEKGRALTAFYRNVMPWKGWDAYDTVSVKFQGQVVATRRDKSKAVHGADYEEEDDLEEATLPDAEMLGVADHLPAREIERKQDN